MGHGNPAGVSLPGLLPLVDQQLLKDEREGSRSFIILSLSPSISIVSTARTLFQATVLASVN